MLAALALLACSAVRGASEPVLLGGLLPLDDDVLSRWPWCGAWAYPVGGAVGLFPSGPDGGPAWRLLRGYAAATDSTQGHRGADIGDGRAGDLVRAAAHGVVVSVGEGPGGGGFGSHVVLAHRLREGGIAYSVYSHLLPGSIRVCERQCVWAGELLAQVGRSGRATTDHLHFEVRLTDYPGLRWERTRAVDPLAYVARRLPTHRADSSRAAPYLDWAERAGLIAPGVRGTDVLSRAGWQAMLARSVCHALLRLPREPVRLRAALIGEGVLPERERGPLDRAPSWQDIGRDLARLSDLGTRLPPGPFEAGLHQAACLSRFGRGDPARDLRDLAREASPPRVADACLLLADLTARTAASPAPPDGVR